MLVERSVIRGGLAAIAFGLLLVLGACDRRDAKPPSPPPPEVGVLKVEARSTPVSVDIVGDIRAFREVDLRSRVTGVIEKQMFRPGQMVKEGAPLFLIDPRSLDSSLADAKALQLEAEANLQKAHQDVERYKPLLPDDAIPRQTYEQAVSAEQQAAALVQSRREAVTRARIDRSFAEVRAPVTGQIGLQKVEVGGLAAANESVLATVSTLDPAVVYFSVPEAAYLAFTRRLLESQKSGRVPKGQSIRLILADGAEYAHPGKYDFTDRAINSQTGTLTIRAVFPNPDQLLLPGMTGRVRIVYDVVPDAIVIPQKAVTEMLGRQFVSVIDGSGKVEQRPIRTGDRLGDQWLIEAGLKAGDTVVVEGVQKARPGSVVKAVPIATAAAVSAPPAALTAAPASAPAAKN